MEKEYGLVKEREIEPASRRETCLLAQKFHAKIRRPLCTTPFKSREIAEKFAPCRKLHTDTALSATAESKRKSEREGARSDQVEDAGGTERNREQNGVEREKE